MGALLAGAPDLGSAAVEEHARRRRDAEIAAAVAEKAAATAAARAAVAIAAAAEAARKAGAAAAAAELATEAFQAVTAQERGPRQGSGGHGRQVPDVGGLPPGTAIPTPTIPGDAGPAGGGRAARRRAIAEAETVEFGTAQPAPGNDPTAVIPICSPATAVSAAPAVQAPVPAAGPAVIPVQAPVPAAAPAVIPVQPGRRRARGARRGRRPSRWALGVAALGGASALVVVLVTLSGPGSLPDPVPAAVAAAQLSGHGFPEQAAARPDPGPAATGLGSAADPKQAGAHRAAPHRAVPDGPEAAAYLAALRAAGIPTSSSGLAETRAAAVVCAQLDRGSDEDAVVRTLAAVLPALPPAQTAEVVGIARRLYC